MAYKIAFIIFILNFMQISFLFGERHGERAMYVKVFRNCAASNINPLDCLKYVDTIIGENK
jgi:hypothetical protein